MFQISGVAIPLRLVVNQNCQIQKDWLFKIQRGEVIAAHCMTEVAGGTDVFSMKTTARRKGSAWIINGKKDYICNAPIADVGLLYTNTAGCEGSMPYNISCFLLDMKKNGVTTGDPHEKMGLSEVLMSGIKLADVELSDNECLAGATHGRQIINISTTFERLLIPIVFVGIMRNLYKRAAISVKAEIYRHIFLCESLLETTLSNVSLTKWSRDYIKLGCLLKWQLSKSYIEVAKLLGDESVYRDALSSWIYSGANDVLKSTLVKLL